jgi:hypothetical protein
MAGTADIAAMKLNAIMGNGSRLKDFIDMAYLSSFYTLEQMLQFFEIKYPNNNSMMAFKSLNWLEDINFEVDVNYVNKTMNWETIKSRILNMLQHPQEKFPPL